MLGRRFVTPSMPDTAVVTPGDGGASARAVVSSAAPLLRAANLTIVNLETVVGTLPDSASYPQKRFLIQSPPESVSALDEMGVDIVNLGNNHQRDWLDGGISSTLAAIDAAGISRVGAGLTETEARAPLMVSAGGVNVGLLSYCSITGDAVNDAYPLDADPVPPGLPPSEAWQYELRSWGFTGATVVIPVTSRRVGSAWQAIVVAEAGGPGAAEDAALWASASAVYPELQDWIARRGHGGANLLAPSRFAPDVSALRVSGADIVVVSLHAAFQYIDTKSSGIELAAYAAIDAGADIVVCHHTHVLQGMEWYKGKLVCWSLGNCVFDQDLLATFRSGTLRTVFEGSTLIEARFYPATVLRYRPAPVSGEAGLGVLGLIHERSDLDFHSTKPASAILNTARVANPSVAKARFVVEGHAARLLPGPGPSTSLTVTASSTEATDLAMPGLTRSRAPGGGALPPGLLFGRDLFGFGSFEDDAADGVASGGLHWNNTDANSDKGVVLDTAAWSGSHVLRLHRTSTNTARARMRPVARVTFADHKLWQDLGGGVVAALDPVPSRSMRFHAAASGVVNASVIVDLYNFDDANPTEDPTSVFLKTVEIPFTTTSDDAWREILVDFSASDFAPSGGLAANMALFYVALYPPASGDTTLRIDDLQFVEWREAALLPDGFFGVDELRGPGAASTVTLERREE
ncbi:MAG: CapA family protein [Planctomycetes bacterium]|nr:CapA family protein [Planctomycetota bacterium]